MSDTPRRYTGQALDITYDTRRCIHAAECVRGLPAVFDTARRPWILPDAASAEQVAAVVARCPSGALHTIRHDDGPEEEAPALPAVRVTPDGPLHVHGRVRLQRADGTVIIEDLRLALCRCGQSRNKPFCDNSHRAAGFADGGEVPNGEIPSPTAGKLTITTLANGPLQCQGDFALCGIGGETYASGRTTLCRCGGSGRKPFCDGSHRRNGFRDTEGGG
jgi:CDGSH-type Zn-finger protein/uncharacterized Fe-S cluster protein YjdI